MVLHFELRVNGEAIGHFEAQRREPLTTTTGKSTYDVTVIYDGVKRTCVVRHWYADGALVLVQKGLAGVFP